jgi:hypothetical protein
MRQHFSHNPTRQVPHISGPYSLHQKAFCYLAEYCLYSIAQSAQPSTDFSIRVSARHLERHKHLNPLLTQLTSQLRLPIVAIPKAIAFRLSRKLLKRSYITQAGRSYYDSRDYSGPTYPHVKTESIEGLLYGVIFAISSFASEALASGGPSESADMHREAIYNRKTRVTVGLLYKSLPKGFFQLPQISRLPDESGAMDKSQSRKEMREVTAEVIKDSFVLAQSEILSDYFYSEHFAIGKARIRAALAQALMAEVIRKRIVNEAKHSYNKSIQVQGKRPPIVGLVITIENASPWTFNLNPKTCTSR